MFGNATAKNLNDLSKDDFLKITGPVVSSSSFDIDARNSVYLATFPSDIGVCTKLVDGELVVSGMPEFASRVKQAYARAKPTLKFGSAYAKAPPKEEGAPLVPTTVVQSVKAPEFDVAYFWNPQQNTKEGIYREVFGTATNFQHQSMFDRYNEHLSDTVLAGEMVIVVVGEPQSLADKDRLRLVKDNAVEVSAAVQKLTPAEANTLYRNFAVFDYISSLELGTPSAAFGGVSTLAAQRLTDLNKVLGEINAHYTKHAAAAGGKAFSPEFYSGRAALFNKLDSSLERITMTSVKIADYPKIKHTLGLSSKSVLHNWRSVTRYNEVPALGKRMEQISAYVKGAERIGWISIALDTADGASKVHEAWRQGDNGKTTVVALREIGRVSTSALGGAWAASTSATVGVTAATGLALMFGVTLGAPVIAVVSVSSAVVGGYYGGNFIGESVAGIIDSAGGEIIRMVRGPE